MEWLDRMNKAINHIEENLDNKIDFGTVARAACCSTYHFQRMFSFIFDMPLSEYIRRRRMTLAAFELQNSNIKIIDLALKYDYDSPVSFTRAFQNVHGVTPSLARDKGVVLKTYPRLSFHISIKGDVEMNYRIEEAKASKLFGKSIEVPYHETKQYESVKDFVNQSVENGVVQSILDAIGYGSFELTKQEHLDNEDNKMIGMFATYESKENERFRFMIAADYPDCGVPDSFEVLDIPKTTWAVFNITSSEFIEHETISAIWKRLPEWFQVSGYKHQANVPDIEKRFKTPTGYLAEVWIPVIKN